MATMKHSSFPSGEKSLRSSLPDIILDHLSANAFVSVCEHLRERSHAVQNIDLMTVSGFCRNCLAKWIVFHARKLSNQLRFDFSCSMSFIRDKAEREGTIQILDSLGYDEAAYEVYGCLYSKWKKNHQKKATKHQLNLFKESTSLHAKHDSDILGTTASLEQFEEAHDENFCQKFLSERILVHLRARAFHSLCEHLRERSNEVQNIDLMTISGFCRNCLAKWLVVGARQISDQISAQSTLSLFFPDQQQSVVENLNAFGYDEAALIVFGCSYPEWKKKHVKEATTEQMERYHASSHLHARHSEELLAARSSKFEQKGASSSQIVLQDTTREKFEQRKNALLSDVCCQDMESMTTPTSPPSPVTAQKLTLAPPRLSKGDIDLRVAILTVSDRAATNSYTTGDLSGPAVERAILNQITQISSSHSDGNVAVSHIEKKIVPDEASDIKRVLLQWSGKPQHPSKQNISFPEPCDLVFTTGGTGFSLRDVTPEATRSILDRECNGLMAWASLELSLAQPLSVLSRGVAGVCGQTLIINLPGNPSGAVQVVDFLFSLIFHALCDLRGQTASST